MKLQYLILSLLLIITGCNWAEWFEKPDEPYRYFYVPDSLRFPYETGDTMIFRSISNNTILYDTFRLENSFKMYPYMDNPPNPDGEIEKVYLKYKNIKKLFSLEETYKVIFGDIRISFKEDTNSCRILAYNTCYKEIELNNILYKNVKFSDYYKEYITVYVNTNNGLIRYITPENNVFDIYKYIPKNK